VIFPSGLFRNAHAAAQTLLRVSPPVSQGKQSTMKKAKKKIFEKKIYAFLSLFLGRRFW
jgi:hypothetical protein